MGANITTIAYLRVLIIEIGSTIILMVVEAQGYMDAMLNDHWKTRLPINDLELCESQICEVVDVTSMSTIFHDT